jgi:hypothetical protein
MMPYKATITITIHSDSETGEEFKEKVNDLGLKLASQNRGASVEWEVGPVKIVTVTCHVNGEACINNNNTLCGLCPIARGQDIPDHIKEAMRGMRR